MTTLKKTPIQQTLAQPFGLTYTHGPVEFREAARMGECGVRTTTERKVHLLDTAIQSSLVSLYLW